MFTKFLFTLLTAMILTVAGATTGKAGPGDGSGADNGNGNGYAYGYGNGNGNAAGNGDGTGNCVDVDLADVETLWLLFMREEEKLARDVYLEMDALWSMLIFENIAVSEQRHMDAMKKLIDCYDLTDPVIDQPGVFWNTELQALFTSWVAQGATSMMDGLIVGALVEETDIFDLQVAISETGNDHINGAYESLMCGSRNHLRAFIRQIEMNGGTYNPTVLGANEFWEIAYSDMELDCGNRNGKTKGKK